MIYNLALLFIGYSVFAALHIALVHFSDERYQAYRLERAMGLLLLAALIGLQLIHFFHLQFQLPLTQHKLYIFLLFSVAPSFYLFSKPLLFAKQHQNVGVILHIFPIFIVLYLPSEWAMPAAFSLGTIYLFWLAKGVYALRGQRSHFKLEIWVLGAVFVIALFVSMVVSLNVMGIYSLTDKSFFSIYSIAIGCAFWLVSVVLSLRPQLNVDVVEAARATYAVSTLNLVDCDDALTRLKLLMDVDHIYQEERLDLSVLAKKVGISTHQLSELINTRLGKGFSRYVREYRIMQAKKRLLLKPSSSILSVGLTVGFSAQSNFYSAFHEIEGMTPGQYRKLKLHK